MSAVILLLWAQLTRLVMEARSESPPNHVTLILFNLVLHMCLNAVSQSGYLGPNSTHILSLTSLGTFASILRRWWFPPVRSANVKQVVITSLGYQKCSVTTNYLAVILNNLWLVPLETMNCVSRKLQYFLNETPIFTAKKISSFPRDRWSSCLLYSKTIRQLNRQMTSTSWP